jgi:glutamine amidotransferase
MIAIIDYGMGNLKNVEKALNKLGKEAKVTDKKEDVENAEMMILPGVGAFKAAMENLKKLNLISAIIKNIALGKSFLGICLGMQLLFDMSEEGNATGLGILKGKVKKIPTNQKIPHMGWNQVKIKKYDKLFEQIPNNSFFYFVHSYYVEPEEEITLGVTNYGFDFASVVRKENVVGVQFHPEKSQSIGVKFLSNFVECWQKE